MRLLTLLAVVSGLLASAALAEPAVNLTPPAYNPSQAAQGEQRLVIAGGCFWGVQGVFQHVKGVTRAVSGYAGGAKATAHYDQVSGGATGHAEAVEITFDPEQVTLGELLRVYFSVAHDPTQLNAQGPDKGPQYRSAIFIANAEQEKIARAYIAQLTEARSFGAPIVTRIENLAAFHAAEAYHQDYLVQHPRQPYIVINDLPKIDNLKRLFPSLYRATPTRAATN